MNICINIKINRTAETYYQNESIIIITILIIIIIIKYEQEEHEHRLFEDKGHWSSFVQKAKFSVDVLLISRVSEDASIEKGTVHISDHGSDVARAVLFSSLTFSLLKVINVGLKLRVPIEVVCFVHRIDLSTARNLDIRMGEDELSNGRVKSKSIEPVSGGENKDGGGRIHAVSSSNKVSSRLKCCLQTLLLCNTEIIRIPDQALFWSFEHSENSSSGNCSINIGRSIERIESSNIFAGVKFINDNWIIFLLRGNYSKFSRRTKGRL
mmetsp:Transcript_617/g.928  ORF Transcript_617/g.928 Transcript_617/m.928 type:complete len:267 (+) Transcript_617:443-1243(+)